MYRVYIWRGDFSHGGHDCVHKFSYQLLLWLFRKHHTKLLTCEDDWLGCGPATPWPNLMSCCNTKCAKSSSPIIYLEKYVAVKGTRMLHFLQHVFIQLKSWLCGRMSSFSDMTEVISGVVQREVHFCARCSGRWVFKTILYCLCFESYIHSY